MVFHSFVVPMKRLKTLELWESVKKNKGADCEKRPAVIEELKCIPELFQCLLDSKWVRRRLNRRNNSLLPQKVLLATEVKKIRGFLIDCIGFCLYHDKNLFALFYSLA